MKKVIGLTGPTGAGKSEVCKYFAAAGLGVIDCDAVARKAVLPRSPVISKLVEAFGEEIVAPDGSINREQLASVAFSTKENTQRLNEIMLPYITVLVLQELSSMTQQTVVLDAPTLLESGLDRLCSDCIAVVADAEVRKGRIIQRDSLSPEQVLLRMQAQPDQSFYTERCSYVIRNDGDRQYLADQAQEILNKIM